MKLPLHLGVLAAALMPLASQATEYATVISSTPVTVTANAPRRVCSDEQRYVQPQPSGAGALIGAIAGGLLGNNIGAGFGRAAATGVGVVAGAAIGNSVEANAYPPADVPVRRCQAVASYEPRVVGYDVVYEYAGKRYSTRLAQDPGPQLALDVRPADAGGYAAPPQAEYIETPEPRGYYAPVPVVAGPPAIYVAPVVGYSIGYSYGGGWGRRHHY